MISFYCSWWRNTFYALFIVLVLPPTMLSKMPLHLFVPDWSERSTTYTKSQSMLIVDSSKWYEIFNMMSIKGGIYMYDAKSSSIYSDMLRLLQVVDHSSKSSYWIIGYTSDHACLDIRRVVDWFDNSHPCWYPLFLWWSVQLVGGNVAVIAELRMGPQCSCVPPMNTASE